MTQSSEPVDAEIVSDDPAPGPSVAAPRPDYDEHGVPSFDYVRDRIERRNATAAGATELAESTAEARSAEQQYEDRERAGKAKLDEIRRSLGR